MNGMTKKTKLDLTWPGKERPKLKPRMLIERLYGSNTDATVSPAI